MTNLSTAVFAGGCFWCTEAVFKNIKGVKEVISGYTGGHVKNPSYREVCMEITGHAEAIKFVYDSNTVSYDTLLELFFATHDPTTLNRQGNDIGTQYRSAIFYTDEAQQAAAEHYINMLENQKIYHNKIVTEMVPLDVFYPAGADHQDYYALHSDQLYCQFIIKPKLDKLEKNYTNLLKDLT